MIWVGIVGAKGYFGEALARLVAGHRSAQVSTMMDLQELGDGGAYMCGSTETRTGYWSIVNAVKKSDIIFNGLTGKVAEDVYAKALSHGKRIIDISDKHYLGGCAGAYPGSVYGLSELYKDKMKGASIVANPSSYCTGAILGLAPLAANNMVDMNSAAIESKSGITSLRRSDKLTETGKDTNGGVKTYKVECKDYAEEVNEQMLTLFGKRTSAAYTSYIIPGIKGITTTINVSTQAGIYGSDILDIFKDFYKTNPFVEVRNKDMLPEVKNGFNKYFCKIGASVDADSGKITVTTVLDDALRGVASQAIQSMNLMCGIDGKTGL
ncbi:MAG: hypothetical protein ACYCYE_03410 [Clostridia bacterium]